MAGRQLGVPITRLSVDHGQASFGEWPYTMRVVAHLVRCGLDLGPGVTVLLGRNGAGKSTLVEALAARWGRDTAGSRSDWLQRVVALPSAEDSDLHLALRLDRTAGGPTGGLFLRAERLHAQADAFSARGRWKERVSADVLQRSHGEGSSRSSGR